VRGALTRGAADDDRTQGKQIHACPYYGVRRAARHADVVCLPYNMLFQAEARRSLGVRLRGRVVVVDEAHNLADAIHAMSSAGVSATELECARAQLAE
jgi:chromosome transmission fidelity protein 1